MKKLKLYLETSVWNFYFADDAPEKRDITKIFFEVVRQDSYEIFISEVVLKEIGAAPKSKRDILFALIKRHSPTELEFTKEAEELAQIYLDRGIIPKLKIDDALHVAIASVSEIDAVISWNYQHLANLRKAELFNAVNLERSYTKRLEIVTPMEVSQYES